MYRNEARYLREWIEFHMLVGFERFYLYDNNSDDNHLEILEPYIAEGIVVLEHWPIAPGQHLAYEDCLAKQRQEADRRRRHNPDIRPDEARWIAFFDIDEFLFSPTGVPVSKVLEDFEWHPAVVVNVHVFGTSGHTTEPEGFVIEHYSRRAHDSQNGLVVKCIVDPRMTYHCFGSHAFLYMAEVDEYRGAKFPEPVFAPIDPVNERHEPITIRHTTPDLAYDLLRINHYWTKSEDVYREKWTRLRGDTGELRTQLGDEHLDSYSAVPDDAIQMYVPTLRDAVRTREGTKD
jgi:hypothetical protein